MSENRLKIGITQGDPNGIGWEVILKTFADPRMTELCTPVIYGSTKAAEFYQKTIADLEPVPFHIASSIHEIRRGKINLILCGDETKIEPGTASPEAGRAAAEALHAAVRDLRDEQLDALVTAPIDKESIQSDDFRYTGHTEFLAAELGGEPPMMMCGDLLRMGLVTIHIPVTEISHDRPGRRSSHGSNSCVRRSRRISASSNPVSRCWHSILTRATAVCSVRKRNTSSDRQSMRLTKKAYSLSAPSLPTDSSPAATTGITTQY